MYNTKSYSASSSNSLLALAKTAHCGPDVEIIPIQKINEAYQRMLKSDVKYRFSIDMASLKNE